MNVDQNKKMRMEAGIVQKSECIRVIVRVRPLNSKEKQAGYNILNNEYIKIDMKK